MLILYNKVNENIYFFNKKKKKKKIQKIYVGSFIVEVNAIIINCTPLQSHEYVNMFNKR